MKKSLNKLLNSESFMGLVFILPALLGIFVFIIIPIICSFALSFSKWDLLNPIKFVGLQNYIELFKEPLFYKILFNTIVYALSVSVFGVIIPLILASVLNSKIRGSEFFKTAYFLPFITPMVVIAVVWAWIFDPNIGFLSQVLKIHINWLYDKNYAMIALIIVSVWKLIGYNMIIFLSSMSSISNSIYEAAKIDGADNCSIFRKITIPMLSPTIFFVVIITIISSFQVFDLIYLMTEGGPFDSTNVLVYAIYKNAFEFFKVGKASAIAYVLFAIILVLTLIQWHFRKKFVYNEK